MAIDQETAETRAIEKQVTLDATNRIHIERRNSVRFVRDDRSDCSLQVSHPQLPYSVSP